MEEEEEAAVDMATKVAVVEEAEDAVITTVMPVPQPRKVCALPWAIMFLTTGRRLLQTR